ncbi:hypothetical protein [Acinetobacter indicus]|uniref:hypothetical protein n=1 Tax=Acinetobacter indicus TaxID=756892 RepID=UPI0039895674
MKTFFLKIKDLKLLSFLIAIVVALPISYLIVSSEVLLVKGWLSWTLGVGVVGVLLLHIQSFFATDIGELGFYYSRLYGMFFSFAYTSLIFLVILAIGGGAINPTAPYSLMVTVLAIGFYNFLRDNYADMAIKHLLGKNLLEKNQNK